MKIKYIKKIGKNKYEITLEQNQKIKTYDSVMLKYQIALKKELSEELLEKINEENKKAEVYEKTLQFMNKKMRSEKEVRTYLKKLNADEEEIIKQLHNQGLFDSSAYIEAYIHDRFVFSNDGPYKIKEELLKQDFDHEQVEQYISLLEDSKVYEKLSKLITKKMSVNHKYSEKYYKQKILESMIQLGYSKNMIEDILSNFNVNDDDILENEARKLYQKYKGKKTGKELFLTIKQKLYQKQYSLEQINEVLEKILQE